MRATLAATARLTALAAVSGVLTGVAAWAFLETLHWATRQRLEHPWFIWFLPVVGLAVGVIYQRVGGRSGGGNGMLLDEIHQPTDWVPRRMAPLVFLGTIASHLVGASVGREGTALQMSGSLADLVGRTARIDAEGRRVLLVASLGGGFSAVFGVPIAAVIFGLEVQRVAWYHGTPGHPPTHRWIRFGLPTIAGATIANATVAALGYEHEVERHLNPGIDLHLLLRLVPLAIALGLTAAAFIEATTLIHRLTHRRIAWAPARPFVGGVIVLILVSMVGREYLGLSLPLVGQALAGAHVSLGDPVGKLVFTALCIGSGFIGGEVTPLFVMGATMGSVVGQALGLDPQVAAALGFVAVFGGASNTPLTCTVMAVELFGRGLLVPGAITCGVAYLVSGQRGIYATQRRLGADGPVAVEEVPRWWPRARAPRRS